MLWLSSQNEKLKLAENVHGCFLQFSVYAYVASEPMGF